MIDWPRIVIELRKWGTLEEIGRLVGVHEKRLVEICAGFNWQPRFEQGMRMLALYDRLAEKSETGRAVGHFQVWGLQNSESLKRTKRGKQRLSKDRASDIQPMATEAGSFDRLVHELEGGAG